MRKSPFFFPDCTEFFLAFLSQSQIPFRSGRETPVRHQSVAMGGLARRCSRQAAGGTQLCCQAWRSRKGGWGRDTGWKGRRSSMNGAGFMRLNNKIWEVVVVGRREQDGWRHKAWEKRLRESCWVHHLKNIWPNPFIILLQHLGRRATVIYREVQRSLTPLQEGTGPCAHRALAAGWEATLCNLRLVLLKPCNT